MGSKREANYMAYFVTKSNGFEKDFVKKSNISLKF